LIEHGFAEKQLMFTLYNACFSQGTIKKLAYFSCNCSVTAHLAFPGKSI